MNFDWCGGYEFERILVGEDLEDRLGRRKQRELDGTVAGLGIGSGEEVGGHDERD